MTQAPIEPHHKDMAAKAAGYEDPELVLRSIGNGHWPGANETAASILAHAQTLANDEAKGKALTEIEKLTTRCSVVHLNCIVEKIAAIAAPYRAKVDPLVEAFNRMPPTFDAAIWAETARKTLDDLGLEIVERRDR